MGICLSFQWPNSLYSNGLMGLQKQLLVNSVQIFFTFIKSIGVIIILVFVAPSLYAFFTWQLSIVILHTLFFSFCLTSVFRDWIRKKSSSEFFLK
ncbi:hypothetical protein RHAB15C_0001310 [Candidatus Rhabdochlamydia porcellionis]|jgi:hypothetical protein|uniref:Uncharacterized protein n=1 Tax=Candidatus Rhabdochlamydia porcellionis TaxID=225148 RepID=A0ABX8Z3E4_9BACT|nr:hypothetical protein RHAB15C_0001310 [Candidatus Rhabdochlamydia porcellionis]